MNRIANVMGRCATWMNVAKTSAKITQGEGMPLATRAITGVAQKSMCFTGTKALSSTVLVNKNVLNMQMIKPIAQMRAYATIMDGFKYAPSHEWVKVEGDTATFGITDFAQSELGDVVYVELPEVGSALSAKETFGVVESVKAASDIYAPIDGEVVEINEELVDNPSMVNGEPFTGGWMVKVKISNSAQIDELLDKDAYEKHCEE